MIDYEAFKSQLINGYRSNYDIEEIENSENGLVARLHMHVLESQCVVFEELRMWDANADEYVYVYRIPHLTDELCEAAIKYAHADGLSHIDLDKISFKHQHMCTHVVALFLCDTADEKAIKRIKKCRIYKSFQFSLKGWMDMHTDLITLTDSNVYSNRYGRETAKFLKMHVKHYNAQNV